MKHRKRKLREGRKRTARILGRNKKEYWTTQAQFWQWVRDLKVKPLDHNPLTGMFVSEDEETLVVIANSILNLAHPNHLRETLHSRRLMKPRKS